MSDSIEDYQTIYKPDPDFKSEEWIVKRHQEFNTKMQMMVQEFKEDMEESNMLA